MTDPPWKPLSRDLTGCSAEHFLSSPKLVVKLIGVCRCVLFQQVEQYKHFVSTIGNIREQSVIAALESHKSGL